MENGWAVGSLTQIDRDTWINDTVVLPSNGQQITSDAEPRWQRDGCLRLSSVDWPLTKPERRYWTRLRCTEYISRRKTESWRDKRTLPLTSPWTTISQVTISHPSWLETGHINVSNTTEFGNTMGVTGAVNMNTLTVVGATDVQNTFDVTGALTFL